MSKKTRMEDYLKKIGFKLLKEQKAALIKLQAKLEKDKKFTKKECDTLEGMICFIDSIQDIAVDEYGYKEAEVFKLSRKEK